MTAYIATEMIDGWADFWQHEAALHRWSIMAGPQPWVPDQWLLPVLAREPRYSVVDDLKRQVEREAP